MVVIVVILHIGTGIPNVNKIVERCTSLHRSQCSVSKNTLELVIISSTTAMLIYHD